jgi:DNA polymerase I-like protein with 3'-5' exonuclease and polymerase domains
MLDKSKIKILAALATPDELHEAIDEALKFPAVGLDFETTSLNPRKGKIRLIQIGTPEKTYVIDTYAFPEDVWKGALEFLVCSPDTVKIAHNAKFELSWVLTHLEFYNYFPESFYCTYLGSILLGAGSENGHGLDDNVKEHLGWEMDKTQQKSDWDAAWLTQEQLEYAAYDAQVMIPLYQAQVKELMRLDLCRVAMVEMDAVIPMAYTECCGIKLDREAWSSLLEKKKVTLEQRTKALTDILQSGVDWMMDNPDKPKRPVQPKKLASKPKGLKKGVPGYDEIMFVYRENQIKDALRFAEWLPKFEAWSKIPSEVPAVINLGSHIQVKKAFKNLGLDIKETNEKYLTKIAPTLNGKQKILIDYLMDHREIAKSVSSFGQSFLDAIEEDGRIHPDFQQIGAKQTGRMSCIAEGQLVTLVNGRKPIEEVEVGDLVYCYDKNTKVRIRKVTAKYFNGEQPCVQVKWQSSGKGDIGELICTPDHLIFTKHRGWVEAENLKRYDKVIHLRRSDIGSRVRLYGAEKFYNNEEIIIKQEVFKAPHWKHIHHKDENKKNNSLDNLAILTPEEHASTHSSGEEHYAWRDIKKFQLLRMISKARGRQHRISLSAGTIERKCLLYGFKWKDIKNRYSTKGVYLSRRRLEKAYNECGNLRDAAKCVGIRQEKFAALCKEMGISYNHTILKVTSIGTRKVYDLEIEDFHNFIASEICVHNCSGSGVEGISVNLQQIPADKEHRDCFIAEDGNTLVKADYSQMELRLLAQFSGDENMCAAFSSGADPFKKIASQILNIPIDSVTKDQRQIFKVTSYTLVYGGGPDGAAAKAGTSTYETRNAFASWKATNYQATTWLAKASLQAQNRRFARTPWGRLIKFHYDPTDNGAKAAVGRNGSNTPLQGGNADVTKRAMHFLWQGIRGTGWKIVNAVHDELILEVPEADGEKAKTILENAMLKAAREVIFRLPVEVEGVISKQWVKG